jgi:hypothetical protein
MRKIIGLVIALLALPSLALADTFSVTTSVPLVGNIYAASLVQRPLSCQNTGSNNLYISFDGTVASSTNGILLVANGGGINLDTANAPITAIASGGTTTLICDVGIRFTVSGAPSSNSTPTLTGLTVGTGGLAATSGGPISSTGGAVPTITCSGGSTGTSVTAGSTNNRGSVVTSSSASTNCTITFNSAVPFPQSPFCEFTDGNASVTPVAYSTDTTSTTSTKFDFASATSKTVMYECF